MTGVRSRLQLGNCPHRRHRWIRPGGATAHAAARPCSRSAMMSSLSSMPIESRTTSGPAPACTFCASVSWRCVVEAGMDDQRAGVADIGEMREQLHVRHELDAGVVAALEAEGEHRAGALRAVFLREVVVAVAGQARHSSPTPPWGAWPAIRATASALSQWRCMRSGSVSMPVRMRKALNGDSAGPMSRRPSTRQAMAKAKLPKVSCSTMP